MLDEPTIGEIVRDIQADVQYLRATQEKTVSREVYDLNMQAQVRVDADQEKRITALEESRKELKRWVATTVLGPLLVAVILYFALGGKP